MLCADARGGREARRRARVARARDMVIREENWISMDEEDMTLESTSGFLPAPRSCAVCARKVIHGEGVAGRASPSFWGGVTAIDSQGGPPPVTDDVYTAVQVGEVR